MAWDQGFRQQRGCSGACGGPGIPLEREPTFLARNHMLLMQLVYISRPQSGSARTPISWVSWAWYRGTHTSDKAHPDLSARSNEVAMSRLPFPLSLLSFLPQIPQGHLLAPALDHGP